MLAGACIALTNRCTDHTRPEFAGPETAFDATVMRQLPAKELRLILFIEDKLKSAFNWPTAAQFERYRDAAAALQMLGYLSVRCSCWSRRSRLYANNTLQTKRRASGDFVLSTVSCKIGETLRMSKQLKIYWSNSAREHFFLKDEFAVTLLSTECLQPLFCNANF